MFKQCLTGLIFLLISTTASAQMTGIASYYADKYDGRRTSSGVVFRQSGMTAASNLHKNGTKLRITNSKDKSKFVEVVVNDSGGFKYPRIVDLSKAAFRKIAPLSQGLVHVIVEVVKD